MKSYTREKKKTKNFSKLAANIKIGFLHKVLFAG